MQKIALLGSIASICGLVVACSPLNGEQANQAINSGAGNVSGNVVGDPNSGIHNIDSSNIDSVGRNIQKNTNEIIQRLPEDKKEVAMEVSNIAVQLIEASATQDNNEIKNNIISKLSNIALIPYRVSSSPFIPPTNKTQLLCENEFNLIYHGKYTANRNDAIDYMVNNVAAHQDIFPGITRSYHKKTMTLYILYLEYDKEKKGPILHYECRKKSEGNA